MSQNRKLTSLVSVVGLFALTGVLVAACGGDDGDGGGGSCTVVGARVEGLSVSAKALTDLAADIKVDVAGACARLANMDAPTGMPTDAQVTSICNAAKARLDANLTASVEVVIVPPVCTVDAQAQFDCEASCQAEAELTCDPPELDVRCDPGELSVQCEGSCNVNAYCEGSATVAVDCAAKCEGECTGTCSGTCKGTCEGMCNGTTGEGGRCDGTCTGTCTGECSTDCTGSCKGSCQVKASGGVSCGAMARCKGGCTGTARAPECRANLKPAECEGSASVDCSADCSGSASLKADCSDPSVRIVGIADTDIRGDFETALPVILGVFEKSKLAGEAVVDLGGDVAAVGGQVTGCALDLGASVVGEFTAAVTATATATASVSVSFQASASVSGSATGG